MGYGLLDHFLKLGTKDTSGIAIKRDMKPIALFAFYRKFVGIGNVRRSWCISPGLCNHVDHQVPGPRLGYLCQRASDRLLGFVRACEIWHRCRGNTGQPRNVTPVYGRAVGRAGCGHYRLARGQGVAWGSR